jgi:hypothetical protein
VGEGKEDNDVTPAQVRRCKMAALWLGLVAASQMTFVSPGVVTRYTMERRGSLTLLTDPTAWDPALGPDSVGAVDPCPALLLVSFLLELIATRSDRTRFRARRSRWHRRLHRRARARPTRATTTPTRRRAALAMRPAVHPSARPTQVDARGYLVVASISFRAVLTAP